MRCKHCLKTFWNNSYRTCLYRLAAIWTASYNTKCKFAKIWSADVCSQQIPSTSLETVSEFLDWDLFSAIVLTVGQRIITEMHRVFEKVEHVVQKLAFFYPAFLICIIIEPFEKHSWIKSTVSPAWRSFVCKSHLPASGQPGRVLFFW